LIKLFNLTISKWKLIIIAGDLVCYFLSIVIALILNRVTAKFPWAFFLNNWLSFLAVAVTYIIVLFIADVYNRELDFRRPINLAKLFFSCWGGAIVIIVIYYFPLGSLVGRELFLIEATAFSIIICCWRYSFASMSIVQRLQKPLIIIGARGCGQRLASALKKHTWAGFSPVGFVDDDRKRVGRIIEGLPVLGDSTQLEKIVLEYNNPVVVVAITHNKSLSLINSMIRVSWNGCQVIDMPSFYEFLIGRLPLSDISDDWILQWRLNSHKIFYTRMKRFFDLFCGLVILILFSPLMLLIALLIKIDSKGPIMFRQQRLGKNAMPFNVLKFRTMILGAQSCGPHWTQNNDLRVTRVGRVIRKWRLDELPQLINILKGDMSFIGPRPLVHCVANEQIPYYNYRFLVRPGLTGWAQVKFPDGLSQDDTREKVGYDLYYIKNMGFLLDFAILLKTLRIVLSKRGI
jgi:exopolysaccharide biosynthesis polyprenyl glycosylphosphotransferase